MRLRDKYSPYYTASGSYRKQLMKQESANAAEMFDHFSRMEVRCNKLLRCPEVVGSHRADITELTLQVRGFIADMHEHVKIVFDFDGEKLHTRFAELYDEAASIVEGFEETVMSFLDTFKVLTEDAQSIQRRNHFTKNHARNSAKSLTAKMAWKRNKTKYTDAIQKFHKSSAGKQMHRNLSRYNRRKGEEFSFTRDDAFMTAKGLSSFCTHLIIEMENFHTQAAGKILESTETQLIDDLQEVFHIFHELTNAMLDSCQKQDNEAVANVLDVISDYYNLVGAGDKQVPDSSGVSVEAEP